MSCKRSQIMVTSYFDLKNIKTIFSVSQCFGVGIKSTTYVLVPFFSRPFNENFKFLKICPYYFHKILNSILHPKVLLRVQWHQNRMTGI